VNWNPLNSLTGRLVIVTVIAVALSYAATFYFYAHERGAALRQAAETAAVERIVAVAQRLQRLPAEQRAQIAESNRDFRARFRLAPAPSVVEAARAGSAAHIAAEVSQALNGAEVRANARQIADWPERWRGHGAHHGPPPNRPVTAVMVSVRLDSDLWLNARVHLPTPRPPPWGSLWAALLSMVAVGFGAALVSRQIGRPLAQLASAAEALGSGSSDVKTPETGPRDVRRAAAAFNTMSQRLGRQLSRQRHMLWALSHDLRTPLTAIRLRAELVDDEQARQRLLAAVADMEQLTEQALSLARAGASDEPSREVDLADVARTLVGELAELGMPLRVEAHEPLVTKCRPTEIARALRNLAENAVKHANGGIVRAFRNAQGEAVLEVLDDGAGVPESDLPRLTDPFYRSDESRTPSKGAGLGLAIAQAIAEAHNGRLVLKNRENGGFSASLILP